MQEVEKCKLKGETKKKIVLDIARSIIRNNDLIDNSFRDDMFLKNILPSMIDTIILLDNKQNYINSQTLDCFKIL